MGSSLLALSGCARAPSYSILGSYFPVWLLCAVGAILATFLLHLLIKRLGWERQLAPPLVVYPALATVICLTTWLIFFS